MWRDYRKQPLAVCVCVTFPNFTHWFSVCFLLAAAMENRKVSLSPPFPHYLLPRSPARTPACLLLHSSEEALCFFVPLALALPVSYYLTCPPLTDRQ